MPHFKNRAKNSGWTIVDKTPLITTTALTYDQWPRIVRRKFDKCKDPRFVFSYMDRGELVTIDMVNPNY
jgi:hypothetical protein